MVFKESEIRRSPLAGLEEICRKYGMTISFSPRSLIDGERKPSEKHKIIKKRFG